ncbi:MAG: DUF2399 domain-containing protein [Peptococcaceae bacterium]|nr:DUF2399 domain-containing protein [Peptococcaceae bacterium]
MKTINQYKARLLSSLLSKYESSVSFQDGTPSKQRPQMTMAQSPLMADYYDEMDYTKRETIHEALRELEAEGLVSLTWPKHRDKVEVAKVYLELSLVDEAYRIAGLTPKADKLTLLRQILNPLLRHPWPWVQGWAQITNEALVNRKSAGLDLDAPELYAKLVKVLLSLPDLKESTPKRVFSQNVLGDSKEFEQMVEKPLLRLLRDNTPEEYETDEEYLDSVNLVIHPKHTLLAGDLQIALNDNNINLSAFAGGLGLSHSTIKTMTITSLPASPILTVENLTTYYQIVQQPSSPWGLVIYTGGFPHSGTQLLLSKISTFIKNNPPAIDVYHWGDIDYGGIRIFQYLKERFFPLLKPHLMDAETYRQYAPRGMEFSSVYAEKLKRLLNDMSYMKWHALLEEMLLKRVRVEQESVYL